MFTVRNAKNHRSQRGFTLAEILVTTAIFAIIMLAALAVYDRSNRVFKTSTESADMQQSTRVGFDKLIADVRMAGFDYSRGGVPTNSWEAAQPDEQIEYAGPTAVAFRANFNYNTNSAAGNGLETAYEPVNINGFKIFPYVTTGNDEIVTYALRSADNTKNTGSVGFYVDDSKPRAAFSATMVPPPAGSNPSKKEDELIVGATQGTCTAVAPDTCGIDLTNNNPPYTLYRITVDDVLNGRKGTPVAENIRSLNLSYYTDPNGLTLLKNSDNTPITTVHDAAGTYATANSGAIGGDGQYDPNSVGTTPNFKDRNQRGLIQSIRVDLVGMNANPDLGGYTHPTETIAAIKSYRQYSLSSLVVPRNLGKTGFPEPSYLFPAPPTITGICTGHCGAPVLYWQAPVGGGPVLTYRIEWDTNPNGAFNNFIMVTDPTLTSYVLPDDGTSDVSNTYTYRMTAQNENGASSNSNTMTATPQNRTRPNPATNLVATDQSLGNAQANQITLTWNSPATNDPAKATLSCSGTGGSTSATNIPSTEVINYRVWRGTTANFDPATSGVKALLFSSAQPSKGSPGSPITWVDSPLTDALSPANCVQYYYRVQAADRCQKQATWNASGSTADSISDIYPPVGTNAIPGYASSNNLPLMPPNPSFLRFDTANSGCPDPINGGPNCKIVVMWDKVTTDSAGNGINVDDYRITRKVKHQNNFPTGTYTLDTTFGTNGQMDVPGYSQISGSPVTYTDNPPMADSNPLYLGSLFTYEYTVEAKGCTGYSALSNPADYPASCTVNPTIIQAGATNPAATGDTPAQAWIMNSGDTITVQGALGSVLTKVKFDVATWPGSAPVDSQTVNSPGPYVYSWSDRQDLSIYQVLITVTDTNGCNEVHLKYVQDQATAPCAFANVSPVPVPSIGTSGNIKTVSNTFTITNSGTDPLRLAIVAGTGSPFTGSITINWADPRTPPVVGTTLIAAAVVWSAGAYNNTDNFSIGTSPITRNAPATMPAIAPGGTFTITVRFTYRKTETAITTSPIRKICLKYRIASEPAVTKSCNLVGQSASTNNPNSCD
jgi:prepilin-type N-terminal cleavage/methylation domain-containing protein